MLKGTKVNLRILERSDLPLLQSWVNDIDFVGEFEPFAQQSMDRMEKDFGGPGESRIFLIEDKKGSELGYIAYFDTGDARGCKGIGYMLQPAERGKGYGSEAVQMMVDYLFLNHDIVRIQAETHPDNAGSQRVLQKAGFTKEGLIRKSFFSRGVYRDTAMWSILREEWKRPRVLPLGYVSENA
jgi:ribosomal-protein-alanine N-acetyltransferase